MHAFASTIAACDAPSVDPPPPPPPSPRRPSSDLDSRRKRGRFQRHRFSDDDIGALTTVFNENPFPSLEWRAELAHTIGASPRSVQVWFQNKRQRQGRRCALSKVGRDSSLSKDPPAVKTCGSNPVRAAETENLEGTTSGSAAYCMPLAMPEITMQPMRGSLGVPAPYDTSQEYDFLRPDQQLLAQWNQELACSLVQFRAFQALANMQHLMNLLNPSGDRLLQ